MIAVHWLSISWVDNSVFRSLITSNVINSSKYTYLANKLYRSQAVFKSRCFYMMKEYQGIGYGSREDLSSSFIFFCCRLAFLRRVFTFFRSSPIVESIASLLTTTNINIISFQSIFEIILTNATQKSNVELPQRILLLSSLNPAIYLCCK